MGIPSYFSYLIKNHPNIIKPYTTAFLCHNLYLDSNSIIYDVYNKLIKDNVEPNSHLIINTVITDLETYIQKIKPTNTVFIAFDGVAPVAKLNQQRERRYKSWYQNNIHSLLFNKHKVDAWNTVSITPGTTFMKDLNKQLYHHFTVSINPKNITEKFTCKNIIVSGSDQVGEGEHKIFQYIRQNPEKHIYEHTLIYGLDADLIMLAINHVNFCPNIYLLREAPHFIQSIRRELNPLENYLLDIPQLTNTILLEMNSKEVKTEQMNNKIKDYIFMCFLLGNDFLPTFSCIKYTYRWDR